jgi:hypothetical protein
MYPLQKNKIRTLIKNKYSASYFFLAILIVFGSDGNKEIHVFKILKWKNTQ